MPGIGSESLAQSVRHLILQLMSPKLYVGNLVFSASEGELQDLFGEYGTVADVHVVLDRTTQRPRGFAFVTMGSPDEAQAAIDALHGQDFQGRSLTVNEARPPQPRGDFGGGGGGGGGGGRRDFGGGGGGGRGGRDFKRSRGGGRDY